jgi:4-O-beta-D-mannosyl-D-glucose phosphorylase
MERQGVEGAYNPGAIFWQGKYCMVVRVEGADRKSFFAIAESDTGVDNFTYTDRSLL